MKKITVFFCGWGQRWPLGTLADNGRQLLFEYSPEALARRIEFSPRYLKLRVEAYGDFPAHQFRLPGLMADSLPDGWGLLLMDRFFRKYLTLDPARLSPLDRLAFIGERAMGALAFEPAADIDLQQADLQLLALAREVKTVVADRDTAALKHLLMVGGSPQGARPKALVRYDRAAQCIGTLDTAPGTPWLMKFPARGEHKEVCAIEYVYSLMARECGLDMPATAWFDLDRHNAAFGIERFDREDGHRVPLHTLAGFLHADYRIPATSYETLLRSTRALTHSEREVQKAFERCVFNVAFNNRDDHTRNFSFRMDASFSWKLAPCYDLTWCAGPGGEHQMDVHGEGRYPGKSNLMALAAANGVAPARASEVIERIATVAGRFNALARDYPIRAATRNAIAKSIEENRGRLA